MCYKKNEDAPGDFWLLLVSNLSGSRALYCMIFKI